MNVNELMQSITERIINVMVVSFWIYMLASLIKWYLNKAKLALKYLFPYIKFFKSKEEKGDDN